MATKNPISQRIALEGGEEVKKAFKDIGAAGEKAFRDLQAASAFSASPLGQAVKSFQTNLTALQAAGSRLGGAFTGFTTAAVQFGGAIENTARKIGLVTIAVAGAATALGVFFKNQAAESERIKNTADALGLSVEAYQTVETAANNLGVETGILNTILTKFAIGAAEAGEEAGKIGDGVDKAAKSLQSFKVQAEGGGDAVITVRRGVQGLSTDMQTFSGSANGGIGALQQFAAQLQKMGSTEEKLLFLSKEFGARGARQALLFFSNLSKVIDEASRSANKILEPLSAVEIAIGVNLDDAVDSASNNLTRLKGRLATLFDPALTTATQAFSDLIFDNSKAILDFAKIVATDAAEALKGFTDSLKGVTFADVVKAYEDVKEGVKSVAIAIKTVATDIIIPAFKAIVAAAGVLATTINSVFGTQLTAVTLLAGGAILKFLGVFRLLTTAFGLARAAGGLLLSFFVNIGTILVKVRGAALALSVIFDKLILALSRFAIVNPFIAVAAGVAFLALKQTDAEKATDAHTDAINSLREAQEASLDGTTESAEALRVEEQTQLAAAKAVLENASAHVELAKALVETGKFAFAGKLFVDTNQRLAEADARLKTAKDRLAEITGEISKFNAAQAKAAAETASLNAALKGAADPMNNLAGAANNLAGTQGKIEGWTDSLQKNVKKIDPAFTEAAIAARQLQETLAKPPVDQPFIEPKKLEEIKTGIEGVTKAQIDAAKAARDSAEAQVASMAAILESLPKGDENSSQILARIHALNELNAALAKLENRQAEFDRLQGQLDAAARTSLPKATDAAQKLGTEFDAAGGTANTFAKDIGDASAGVKTLATDLATVPAATSAFAQAATTMTNLLVAPFTEAKTQIETIWTGLETFLTARLNQFSTAIDAVVARIRAALAAVQIDLARANAAAGAGGAPGAGLSAPGPLLAPTGADQAAQAVLASWRAVQAGLAPIFEEIAGQASSLWSAIAEGAVSGLAGIASGFQQAVAPIPGLWQEIVSQIAAAASNAASSIVAPFTSAEAAIQAGWASMIAAMDSMISSFVNRVESLLARLRAQLASLRAAIAAAQSEAAGQGLAGGGSVRGPGGPTGDRIPLWGSDGEFMVRAAAVKRAGLAFMYALNSGRYTIEELLARFAGLRLPKFSMGGLLDGMSMPLPGFNHAMMPAAAGAAAGPSGSPIYLRIGNETVGPLRASVDVVGQLMRHGVREQTLSLGRKSGRL